MGARLNWLAVQAADKASLLARLRLVEAETASDEFGSALACAVFPDGWLVLVSTGTEFDLDKALPLASADGLTLACEIEEHIMFSRLRAFQGGALTWAVTHDPEISGTAVDGEPPPPFAEVRAALSAQQADEDQQVDHLFELPVRLGQALCGYSHDEPHGVVWTPLERRGKTRGGRTAAAHPPRPIEPKPTTRVPAAFAAVLEPSLLASGWARGATEAAFQTGAWWFERVKDGRFQLLRLWWSDYGPAVDMEAIFVLHAGPDSEDKVVLRGETRVVREVGEDPGLHRRIATLFRPPAADLASEEPPASIDPVDKLIARVKGDLAAIEALLTTGEESPRLRINHGSADFLRPGGG